MGNHSKLYNVEWCAALARASLRFAGRVLFARAAAGSDNRNLAPSRGNRKNGGTDVSNLFPNKLLQSDSMKLFVFKTKVKRSAGNRFIGWIVEGFEESVLEGIIHGDALFRVNLQHFTHYA